MMLLMLCVGAHGQPVRTIQQEMGIISAYNTAHTPDKIFIQTDKWHYFKGDTLRFKSYVFDAVLAESAKSGLMYIEIADADNRILTRNMVSVNNGIGWGNIALSEARYPEGTYTLRAYTNWMLNFDKDYIFTRQFNIEGELDEDWMINSRFELNEIEGVNNVKTNLSFVTNEGYRMFAEEFAVRIKAGDRTLYRSKLTTDVDGTLAFDFNLPDKVTARDINISLTKKTKKEKDVTFNVPVIINREGKTDLQFMPEGGSLISGMLNNVAFKAINEEGKGVDVAGGVYDSKGKKVAEFKSMHAGMGLFELNTEANQTYTAKVNYRGKQLSFALPRVKSSGIMLKVNNTDKDSIVISVIPSADVQQARGIYYLVGQALSTVCYGAVVNIAKGNMRFKVHRSAFPTGVARFTLLSQSHVPIAERILFIDHNEQINIKIVPSKAAFTYRDSVKLSIIATDKDGAAVAGSFSLAVTDDAQAKPDTSGRYDLPDKVLLADDLKGNVENPGWYFSKGDSISKAAALDVLLLTQGWVNYNWKDVFSAKPKQLAYKAEPEFAVKGRVINVFNTPVETSNIFLLGLRPTTILQTQTNAAGEFSFTGINPPDTVSYNIQAKNKRGKAFNVAIELDDFVPPAFTADKQRTIPLYVNIDTSRLTALRTRKIYNDEEAKLTGRQLQEVNIKASKIIKGSYSLNDPGEADFTLNSDDVKALPRTKLIDAFKTGIPGFKELFPGPYPTYKIGDQFLFLVIDGMPYRKYWGLAPDDISLIKFILETMEVVEVKGIEVMTSGKNTIPYQMQYMSGMLPGNPFAFVEVTTYAGNGFSPKIIGSYTFTPPVFAQKKEFYSPKYTVKAPVLTPDTRSTIFWEPNVVTDEKGRASVSFYTADKTATYTVNVQGADMMGLVGAGRSKIAVKKSP